MKRVPLFSLSLIVLLSVSAFAQDKADSAAQPAATSQEPDNG
jgi:hypothetical protein